MSEILLRSEGRALRPFAGLQPLDDYVAETFALEVESGSGNFSVPSKGWLGLSPQDIDLLGLKINMGNVRDFEKLVDPVVMDIKDVTIYVMAMDRRSSILRESTMLAKIEFAHLEGEISIALPGEKNRHRILNNRHSGFRIELILVQNKNIPGGNSIKPRKKGAIISRASWEVKAVSDGESFQPEELTDEVRDSFGLRADTWLFFESKSEILTSKTFSDAVSFYVDESLLLQVQLLTGEPLTLAEMLLYSSAITHLVYEFAFALKTDGENVDPDEFSESQIMRLFRKRFPTKTDPEIVEFVRDEPARAVAEFLGKRDDFKGLLLALETMNGGSNELSDIED